MQWSTSKKERQANQESSASYLLVELSPVSAVGDRTRDIDEHEPFK